MWRMMSEKPSKAHGCELNALHGGVAPGAPSLPFAAGVEHGSLSGLAGNVAADWFLTNAHTLPNEAG